MQVTHRVAKFICASSGLVLVYLLTIGPVGKINDLAIHVELLSVRSMNEALKRNLQKGLPAPRAGESLSAVLDFLRKDSYYSDAFLPDRDHWGSQYAFRATTAGTVEAIYSIGKNKTDENGAGDDIVPEPKHYPCEMYGVDCEAQAVFPILLLTFFGSGAFLLLNRQRPRREPT